MGDFSENMLCGAREDVLTAVAAFARMQAEHLAALAEGNCKNCLAWQSEREERFMALALALESVHGGDFPVEKVFLAELREMIQELLRRENALRRSVEAKKNDLRAQLDAMRRGRGALQGYSINRGLVPRPKYLSNRM
ncbi:hypothetical protein ACUUL3_10725 [Thiovibrio sp. JS02]